MMCVMLKLIMMSVFLRASRLSKNYACIYAYLGGLVVDWSINTVKVGWMRMDVVVKSSRMKDS